LVVWRLNAARWGSAAARLRGCAELDVIAKLNAAENARLRSPEIQASIARIGLQPRVLTSQEFAAVLADEVPLWKAVVDEAGVHLE
jgi:tripartite-type tricarboxylate transporter receptor subunit TctC